MTVPTRTFVYTMRSHLGDKIIVREERDVEGNVIDSETEIAVELDAPEVLEIL